MSRACERWRMLLFLPLSLMSLLRAFLELLLCTRCYSQHLTCFVSFNLIATKYLARGPTAGKWQAWASDPVASQLRDASHASRPRPRRPLLSLAPFFPAVLQLSVLMVLCPFASWLAFRPPPPAAGSWTERGPCLLLPTSVPSSQPPPGRQTGPP